VGNYKLTAYDFFYRVSFIETLAKRALYGLFFLFSYYFLKWRVSDHTKKPK